MAAEGFIEVTGGRVWFARSGPDDGVPVLLLHGGPGAGHDYLEPLAERLSAYRPVVVYDQLGCGRSDRPDDTSLWTVDRFVAEIDQVRAALRLDRCHLLGQSWGGWLAIDYMVRGRDDVLGLVLASTSASIAEFVAGATALFVGLPAPHGDVLREYGARGEYDTPEYQAAVHEFYVRHLCRLDPWPDCVNRTVANLDGNQVYMTMNGPTEFDVVGSLKTWDRAADLARIGTPTLVTCGRHDEIVPSCSETIARGIAGARMVVFEESAHLAHVEEADRYAETVEAFLRTVQAG